MNMNALLLPAVLSAGLAFTLRAAEPAEIKVTHIDHSKVNFVRPGKVLENSEFKIAMSKRDKSGVVEIHAHDTDTFYIVDGEAEFVTGGTVVDLKEVPNGESTGREITGGETHHLKKGDMMVIPRGVPHWFKDVKGQISYYVVKVVR